VNSLSGLNQPLYIIDGIPYSQGFQFGENPSIQNIDPSDIESIDILKGVAAATLYGSQGANGVVLISTKNNRYSYYGSKVLVRKKFLNYSVANIYTYETRINIHNPSHFYVPAYDTKDSTEERTDFRKTIYWNPVVQTDKEGKATMTFYNSDALTSFNIKAAGITANGLINQRDTTYSVQKPFFVSAKIPSYCALNDTIAVPVTIENNTLASVKAKLEVNIPKEFHFVNPKDFSDSILVKSKSTLSKKLRLIPKKLGSNLSLGLMANADGLHDNINRELEVVSPYFPIHTSISNNKNGSFTFDITNPIPETTQASFKVYTDIIGDVMAGVEGIIREPYGCFEQTSSATYPNIMVLKYLKESGRYNADIESEALGYIKKGYKRLIGFETKQGGFEWFGKTPPHETLTAYGIMEFMEMKEVYNGVDQRMLNRTIKWLLGQKDGKGGFHKSKKGYDSFTSSPEVVANAYIVYALSEAGLVTEIDNEYSAALKEALASNDPYRMALMALTAHNLGHLEDYENLRGRLLEELHQQDYEDLVVDNTITRSYGNAKQLETTALIVLALLKGEHSLQIEKGIQYITTNKKYGRYGSTQSTVLCLKALLEYTKKQNLRAKNEKIQLVLNGNTIDIDLSEAINGVVEYDNFSDFFVGGEQTVTVKFKNPTNTLPYSFDVNWQSRLPKSAQELPVTLTTKIVQDTVQVGGLARMAVEVKNTTKGPISMTTAVVGIPSGASLQLHQLRELLEKEVFDYFEIQDNFLVLYWRSLSTRENKIINLDLKAEIPGTYKASASNAYPYYGDEQRHWVEGVSLKIID